MSKLGASIVAREAAWRAVQRGGAQSAGGARHRRRRSALEPRRRRVFGLAGSPMLEVWRGMGLPVAGEAFADRRYEPDGSLRSRKFADALITDPAAAAAQAVRLAREGRARDHLRARRHSRRRRHPEGRSRRVTIPVMKWLLVLAAAASWRRSRAVSAPTPPILTARAAAAPPFRKRAARIRSLSAATTSTCPWPRPSPPPLPGSRWASPAARAQAASPGRPRSIRPIHRARRRLCLTGNWMIPVVQLANTCVPDAACPATSASAAVGGGPGSFSIQTVCQWNASGNRAGSAVHTPTNGTGNGSVNYTVAANGCVAGRSGTVTA